MKIPLPAEAEVVIVSRAGGGVGLLRGSPIRVTLDARAHPTAAVDAKVRRLSGPPRLVHSTSWRHEDGVILTYIAVVDAEHVPSGSLEAPRRDALARSAPDRRAEAGHTGGGRRTRPSAPRVARPRGPRGRRGARP